MYSKGVYGKISWWWISSCLDESCSQNPLVPGLQPDNGWGEKEEDEDRDKICHKISHKIRSQHSGMEWDSLSLHKVINIEEEEKKTQDRSLCCPA